MSTSVPASSVPEVKNARVAIVTAEWNGHITSRLAQSARTTLLANGFTEESVTMLSVPGAVELTFGASHIIETGLFDAVIVVGCVVRGGTPHFDYVCQSVTQGVTALNADCDIPVIFCVLTVDTEQDALDRAGGSAGDKGREAAETAIKMIDYARHVADLI